MSFYDSSLRKNEYIRFINDQYLFQHNEQVTKDLLHERGFVMKGVEEKASEFYALLQRMGWGPLVEDLGNMNETWVREFYANLPMVVWNHRESVAYVRGRLIPLTPIAINEALGLPNPSEEGLNARNVDGNVQWLVDTLVVEEHRASTN